MSVVADLSEAEAYLFAILQDQSGIDPAEFAWTDETSPDFVFRCYDYQYGWYRDRTKFQIDLCGRAVGKALDVDTPVPVPGGWTTMGELQAGDLVYGLDGRPARVLEAFDVLHDRECFEISFETGDTIVADRDHLWTVRRLDLASRRCETLTTGEMAGRELMARGSRYAIDVADAVTGLRGIALPVPPWLLGYWLGDGDTRTGQITVGAQDIDEFMRRVEDLGYRTTVRSPRPDHTAYRVSLLGPDGTQFGRQLTAIGAKRPDRVGRDGAKNIPELYLLASIDDRRELLRGFMDADGCASRGRASFDLMAESLASQFVQLVNSLGERCHLRQGSATLNGRVVGVRQRAGWLPRRFNPFGYKRKADQIRLGSAHNRHMRSIRRITPVASRPVRCITVDSPDHLFLVGRGHVATHNSLGIQMRSWAFPFTNPGEEMLITAPEMIHLDPVTRYVEDRLMSTRLTREFLKKSGTSNGFTHRPFEARFRNGASIKGRIPQKDGKGVKGQHPKKLELDEAQDYPDAGWVELGETLKFGQADATWRAHGVSRGIRDRYYKQTQPESGWKVHRVTGMHRGDWSAEERQAKAELYGSRDHADYRRNILGLHGDAQSPLFVLHRLMQCVDEREDSFYNSEYRHVRVSDEKLIDTGMPIEALLEFPLGHKAYERTWAGMDVGMTNHPSEILIYGEEYNQRKGTAKANDWDFRLKLLTRIHLQRISAPDQRAVLEAVWDFYKPQAIAMDRTGLGLPIYQEIVEAKIPGFSQSMRGYNFSEKLVIAYEENDDDPDEPIEVRANVLEFCVDEETEALTRNGWVSHDQLREGTEIWALDPDTRFAGWTPVQKLHRFDGQRPMRLIENRMHSSLTTLSHRWLTTYYDVRQRLHRMEWRTTEDLRSRSAIPLVAPSAEAVVPTLTDAFVELLGWFWAEGCLHRGRATRWCGSSIGQSNLVNPDKVERIRKCLLAEFGEPGKARDGGLWYDSLRANGMVDFHLTAAATRTLLGYLTDEKALRPGVVATFSRSQLGLFLGACMAGDASSERQMVQVSRERIETFAMACTLAGIATHVYQLSNGSWMCSLLARERTMPLYRQGGAQQTDRVVQHEGVVWCPQTEFGTWFARRRGTTYFTGNSSDMLRLMVDQRQVLLPWDVDLIREFQGQTYQVNRSSTDPYGKKKFNQGKFHGLDAARMAVLGYKQSHIEQLQRRPDDEPILDAFLQPGW